MLYKAAVEAVDVQDRPVMHKLANRTNQIKPFRVMEVLARAQELEAQGYQVVHFEVGEPDFATAEPIVAAGRQALLEGLTKYTNATGIEPLRRAISRHYANQGISVDAAQIVVTSGASAGLTLLSALLLNPDDELLITDPGYPCNEVFARLVGAHPRALTVGENNRFQPTADDLCEAWGERTKGALLASPANPTGTMLDAVQLAEICSAVSERDGFLILDEIYQGIVRQAQYSSGLQISRDIYVLNSFSKYFGMTGWRLGWIVIPEHAVSAVTKLAQNLFISPNTTAQYAALSAFEPEAMKIHAARVQTFAERADRLTAGLVDLGFRIPVKPEGAFYLYVDISNTGMDSNEFCWQLLNDFQVAVTPGEDFGEHEAQRYVRFAFTTDEASIDLGLARLQQALSTWQAR